MANETDTNVPDVILTEEGALTPEEFALRQQLGTAGREITGEEALAAETERVRLEASDAPVETFVERGVSAATFGLTDTSLFVGAEEAEERRRRIEANPLAATAGTVTGTVLPGLLSGGSGAVGTLGTLARFTPAGRMAVSTGRLAARGGLARVTGAGAIEGMAAAAGDYVSRVSLDENAEFSAEALLGEALQGAAFGGLAAGATSLAAGALGRVASKADDARLGQLADEVPTPTPTGPSLITAPRKVTKKTNFKSIVRRQVRDDDAGKLRALGDSIDDAVARGPKSALDEIVTGAEFRELADASTVELAQQAQGTAQALEKATREAQQRFKALAHEVDLASASKRLTKDASQEVEDALVTSVAEADQLALRYDREVAELRARVGMDVPQPPSRSPALEALDQDVTTQAQSLAGRVADVGTKAVGVTELARSAGVDAPGLPSVRDIPVVGSLMGLYLQAKGAAAAARGVGILPMTRATAAASTVVSRADRLRDAVSAFAQGTARRVAQSPQTPLTAARVAAQAQAVRSLDPVETGAAVGAELDGTTPSVQQAALATTQRAVAYLQEKAPQDPMPYRPPGTPPWKPSVNEAAKWDRRVTSVTDPAVAVDTILSSPNSWIELEVLESVYPAMLSTLRQQLLEQADELFENQSTSRVRAIAMALNLPILTVAMPGYGQSQAQAPSLTPQPMFSRPSTPGASPTVNLEKVTPGRL